MVKGGRNFRKHAGQRRKKRKGPMRAPLSVDIDMVQVELVLLKYLDHVEIPATRW